MSAAKVDVLAVIRRHAESHRSLAGSDAYSEQEAPRLEAALAAVAELIEAARHSMPHLLDELRAHDESGDQSHPNLFNALRPLLAALSNIGPQS